MIDLFNGDCIEKLRTLPTASIDLAVLDPPYSFQTTRGGGAFGSKNREYHGGLAPMAHGLNPDVLSEVLRVLKAPNLYIWGNWRAIIEYLDVFRQYNTTLLAWHKTNPPPLCSNKYLTDTEYCLHVRAKGVRIRGGYADHRTWWATPLNTEDRDLYGHPTPKPVDITRAMIRNSSDPGQVVLDPFLGSGTTGVAAIMEGRGIIGCEIEPKYYKTAKARIEREALWAGAVE